MDRDRDSGFRVSGFGSWVSGFGLSVSVCIVTWMSYCSAMVRHASMAAGVVPMYVV